MKKICMVLLFVLLFNLMNSELFIRCYANTTIYDDETEVYVQNMDNHSEGVVPAASMAIRAGQWFEYRIDSPVEGDFRFILYFSYRTTWSLKITLNGIQAYQGTFNDQSGDDTHFYSELCTLHLKKGMNTIRLERVSNDYHIAKFVLKSVKPIFGDTVPTSGAYKNMYLPTIIQAEDFDYGTKGSYSSDGKKSSNIYREDSVVTIKNLAADKTGIILRKSNWVNYSFNADISGVYNLKASTVSYGGAEFYIDGLLTAKTGFPGSDDYKELEVCAVYLSEGKHELKVKSTEGDLEIDYFRFISSASKDYVFPGDAVQTASSGQIKTDAAEHLRPVYKTFYVSGTGSDEGTGEREAPFQTISRAKEEAAKFTDTMTGDIIIDIAPGEYQLTQTELFSNKYSGKNGFYVILRGESEENKPLLSGGVKIRSWEKESEYIYKTKVDDVDDIRNLYVNGFAAQRARSKYGYSVDELYKKENSPYESDGFYISKRNFPDHLTNIRDIELSWTNEWVNQRTPVDQILDEGDRYLFLMRQPAWTLGVTRPYETTRAGRGLFYIENAHELLDEPGEFYFDRDTHLLYYYPFKEEDMKTAQCYAGKVEGLLSIEGNSVQEKASNIILENIDFRYGETFYVSRYGFISGQAGNMLDTRTNADYVNTSNLEMPAQIKINKAQNIQVRNCSFINMGSTAISMENAAADIQLIGNTIRDCMGGGISIGRSTHDLKMPAGEERPARITIKDNAIYRVAQGYYGLVGICAYYVNTCAILNNDIADLPYTGISFGWGWGTDVPECKNFTIANNRVYNTVYLMHDGGPIYSLGPIRGTKIYNNYFVKSPRGHAGIYHDNGSRYMETYKNVVEDCALFVYLNKGGGNNLVHDNYSDTGEFLDKSTGSTVEKATVFKDANWSGEAKAIVEGAGLEQNYKHLLKNIEIPEYRGLLKIPKAIFSSKSTSTIWAADYKKGGQNVAYYDTTPGNAGNKYRNEDVDIWQSSTVSGRYDVGVDAGEWLKYDTFIGEPGKYNLIMWTSNAKADKPPMPSFKMYLNEELLVDEHPITYTKTGNSYDYTVVNGINLKEGKSEVKLEGLNAFFGICYFKFEKAVDSYLDSDFDEGVIEVETEKQVMEDIQSHWARPEIEKAIEQGIVKGTGETAFSPDDNVTTPQAVLMLARTLGYKDEGLPWEEVASNCGLIDSKTALSDIVTREEFINLVMNAYLSRNAGYRLDYNLKLFNDLSLADPQYINPILGAKYLGFIQGDENDNFNPKSQLTRAEAVVIIMRLMGS